MFIVYCLQVCMRHVPFTTRRRTDARLTHCLSCDIHTHTSAPRSSTSFLLYPFVLHICSTSCFGRGHGYEFHSPSFETRSFHSDLFGSERSFNGSLTTGAPHAHRYSRVHRSSRHSRAGGGSSGSSSSASDGASCTNSPKLIPTPGFLPPGYLLFSCVFFHLGKS